MKQFRRHRLQLMIIVVVTSLGWFTHIHRSSAFAEEQMEVAANNGPAATQQTIPTALGPSDFGLSFVNSAEEPSSVQRIRRGVESGAQIDRFPLYWGEIEKHYAQFDWSTQDAVLRANQAEGLQTLAILLGTPGHYQPRYRAVPETSRPTLGGSFVRFAGEVSSQSACQEGTPPPSGLYNAIFIDGTDLPDAGKAINPDNYWARFVHAAVNRYRPGGVAGLHVRHWQIGNEPDLCKYWSGTVQDYARLLKVAYLVIKQSDPEATVLWAGLAHFANGQFLYDLVNTLKSDPLAAQYDGFFDAAASHHYSLSWNSYDYTNRVRMALNNAGWVHKPIWITESGVPVCDDYPGPQCPSPWRATPTEQAAYIWQNVAYTRLAGGGPILHFMLHDDCGNVVAVDSPDGFGLVKNESSSFCSPANAEPRLAYTAYQLAVRHFTRTDLLWGDIQNRRTARRVAFYHPATQERRTLVWSIVEADTTVTLEATGSEARMISLDGSEVLLYPIDGVYSLPLAGATNRNWPHENGYDIGIYGVPYLLIERDTVPPVASIDPLTAWSPLDFPVGWRVEDRGSGLQTASLWVQVDGGEWQLWQDNLPATGTHIFSGEVGRRYGFAIQASDRAGNALTPLAALAETQVVNVEKSYLPLISR